VTVNGTITSDNEGSSNTSTFTLGNSSPTLNLGGSTCFSLDGTGTSTIILNGTGATVNYNRSGAQNVYATTYTNLITSGSGIKTLAGNSSITGNLTVNSASTLDLSTYTANRSISGGTLTVASGATLKIGGTNTLPSNYSTHTIECASTVEYSGGNQTITEPASTATYGNLILSGTGTKTLQTGTTSICNNFTMSGTSPSATAVVGITIGGSVTLGSGTTFNAGSYTHNVAGSWTNNGATFTASASTINFNGSNVANINGSATTTFYNLTINKDASSTKVLSSQKAFNVNNDLTVAKGILQLDAIDANYVVSKNLTVNTGATLKHNAGWIDATSQYVLLSVGGNLIIEGTYDYSDQTRTHIQMSGTGTKNISAPNTSLSILTLLDGDYYATGNVNINDNFWSMFGSTGSFHTNGQTVTAQAAVLNNGGTLDINGGVLNVTGGLSIVAGNLSGACTFSNGELNADIVTIGNGATTGTLTQSGGTANIGNLSISSTGTYTCTNSPAINLSGDWTNNGGTFTPATSTVTFNGSGAQNINGSVATQTFNNLVVNKTAGTTLSVGGSTTTLNVGGIFTETQGNFNAPATMAVTGNITLAAGTFTAGSSLTAGGHWTNNGATFTHNNGTVTFNGSSQKIGGSYANTFYNLTINGSAVVLNSLAYPQLTTVSNILTINSSKVLTVPAAQQLTVNGTTYLNGTECLVIDCASDGTTPSGSFIDNGFAGSGTAKVNRYFDNSGTAGGISWDWHLLSSPVTSQAIWPAFVPSPPSSWTLPTDWDFYYYNPNTPYVYPHTPWVNIKTATGAYNSGDFDKEGDDAGFGATTPPVMRIARGYLVAYDNAGVKSFIGSLNTGTVNATVKNTKDSFNLVGNPYPSSIDWKSSALGRSNLKDVGSGKYAYWVYNEDYGNYGTILSDASVGTNGTTNFIAPGQGFFCKSERSDIFRWVSQDYTWF